MKIKPNIYSVLVAINLILLIILIVISVLGISNYKHNLKANKTEPAILDLTATPNNDNVPADKVVDNTNSNIPPQASIIIAMVDIGLSNTTTQAALQLAPEIIMGVSAYSSDIDEVIKGAIGYNHTILLNIPMEPINYPADDPGPYALLTQLSNQDNLSRLGFLLNRNSSINGIYSDKGEVFTSNVDNVKLLMKSLKQRNLIYISGAGQENVFLTQLAKSENYNLLLSDLVIDEEINIDQINIKLNQLEKLAIDNKLAIGIARPYPSSIEALNKWLPTLESKGIKLTNIQSKLN